MNTAEMVKAFRAEISADPEIYDGDIDVAMWLIDDTPSRTWTPSEIGKALHISTAEAAGYLRKLAALDYIASNHRGAWTRYYSRRGTR
jgi:hypothetical protein